MIEFLLQTLTLIQLKVCDSSSSFRAKLKPGENEASFCYCHIFFDQLIVSCAVSFFKGFNRSIERTMSKCSDITLHVNRLKLAGEHCFVSAWLYCDL